ncbi:MAG: peptidase T [Planctomycetaceae bacterium]|nr:peptidase T [Planctomycetales bacterium]MCB9926041.1 peptidase T [Planctomycetaceae bacterium]
MVNRERLLRRFLHYVRVDTTAIEGAACYPSSPGQLQLGSMLVDELRAMGLSEVTHSEHGIVIATLPARGIDAAPVVAFNAHLDTSPETTGADVKAQVIDNYSGGDIALPGDASKIIRVSENPELNDLHGCTLITTDGTTLLGGDDKAGLAVIMEMAESLLENESISHGPIRLLFTCDEEIGHGIDHVDIEELAATACYTLDGGGAGDIDYETFSADLAIVTVNGINIHPSIAKDKMVNAIRAAAAFVDELPRHTLAPETTDGREGFIHPYQIEGGVAKVTLKIILRDFETEALADYAKLLRDIGVRVEAKYPGTTVSVETRRQYRNMREGLIHEPRAVRFAQVAHERLGREAHLTIVRGGTDGSQLTERGLPTPNLSTGQHNPHSPLEWACLGEMIQATEVLIELVQVWAENRPIDD